MNINNVIRDFKDYVDEYLNAEEKNSDSYKNLLRKYNHSLRVMDLAKSIAIDLGLNGELLEFVQVVGLFHDIGRFEQWKRYHTFQDSKSVDHADYSVFVLKNNHLIDKYIKDEKLKNISYKAIKYHNKYKVPSNFSKETKQICNIIREADKIDLLNIISSKERVVNIGEDAFSEKIMNTIRNKKLILLSDRTTKADFLASNLAFIFDMNYVESFKLLKEKNYINTIIDVYKEMTNNEELKRQLEESRKIISEEIEERIQC